MPDRPLRADAQLNRDKVLRAARDAFAASGYGVPLDEIAARAGVGPGTVYRHFPSKEELFEAVAAARVADLTADARPPRRRCRPGPRLLRIPRPVPSGSGGKARPARRHRDRRPAPAGTARRPRRPAAPRPAGRRGTGRYHHARPHHLAQGPAPQHQRTAARSGRPGPDRPTAHRHHRRAAAASLSRAAHGRTHRPEHPLRHASTEVDQRLNNHA